MKAGQVYKHPESKDAHLWVMRMGDLLDGVYMLRVAWVTPGDHSKILSFDVIYMNQEMMEEWEMV